MHSRAASHFLPSSPACGARGGEGSRVGGTSNSPHPAAHVVRDDPPHRFAGGGKNQSSQKHRGSRGARRARVLQVIASQRVRPEVAGPMTGSATQSSVVRGSRHCVSLPKRRLDGFVSLAMTKKGGGTPTSALSILRAIGRGARSSQTVHASPRTQSASERARLSAFHRGSRLRDCSSRRLSVGPCFLGRGRSVRSSTAAPTGGRRPRAAPRHYPRRACPSPVEHPTRRS